VADDHALFSAALSAILKRDLKFSEVTETGSFEDALAAMERAPEPAFATFDLAMPGMDIGKLALVRERFPALRIALVTASLRREDILSALAAGAHGYVPKLLGVGELTSALRTIVDGAVFVPSMLTDTVPGSSDATALSTSAPGPNDRTSGLMLTPRQKEVLRLLGEGRSNKEIARLLNLGEGTVKVHLAALFRNLGVRNRTSAVATAVRVAAAES
jgi:DNA-binding NarL/FixJ family response regulator